MIIKYSAFLLKNMDLSDRGRLYIGKINGYICLHVDEWGAF